MNIPKAIEIKQLALDTGIVNNPDAFKAADQLSIEAMKLVDNLRFDGSPYYPNLLPGETED